MEEFHTPVLLQEVIEGLAIKSGKKYIDATLGGGGHALEMVKRGGIVLGIDVDQEAIDYVRRRWKMESGRWKVKGEDLILVHGNFKDLGEIARRYGFDKVSGILFDLGVSLHQLQAGERGFSFIQDAPLDMRMDPSARASTAFVPSSGRGELSRMSSGLPSATAADLVNGLYEHELADLFEKYGEERLARAIARAICRAREVKKIETTGELVKIIERTKRRKGKLHPATKIFQALRIAVNDELGNLTRAMPQAVALLKPEGRVTIISFHSLEDRIVKNFFKVREDMWQVTKKPIVPSAEEVKRNLRSRSAKLRIYEKN